MTFQLQYLFFVAKKKKMFRFTRTAWSVSNKSLRAGIFELRGRNFQRHVFTKSRPLFLLPDKFAFHFVGKMNRKYEKKADHSLSSKQVL